MAKVKQIHFGWFVRRKRHEAQKKVRAFAVAAGITEKRLIDIEKMPTPKINEGTRFGIAAALGMTIDQLDEAWRSTRVAPPEVRKAGHQHYGTRILRLPAALYAGLSRMAARDGVTVEQLLAGFVAGSIDENLEVIEPIQPKSDGGGTRGRGSAPTIARGR